MSVITLARVQPTLFDVAPAYTDPDRRADRPERMCSTLITFVKRPKHPNISTFTQVSPTFSMFGSF